MSQEFRTVLLDLGYQEDIRAHEWKIIKMAELKRGNKFKLMEPDGTIVKYEGTDTFEAVSDAFEQDVDGQKIWSVSV